MHGFYTNVARYGNSILYRGYNKNGREIRDRIKFQPSYYVNSKNESPYKSLFGENLERIKFDNIRSAREFKEKYSEVDNFTVHGNSNFVAQFIAEHFPGDILFDIKKIRIGDIDIEVMSDKGFPYPEDANFPVISIAYNEHHSNIFYVWGLGEYDTTKAKIPEGFNVKYVQCKDEIELLIHFIHFWSENYPDAVTGWNIRLFDIPYLVNRIRKVLGEKESKLLSPWKLVNYKQIRFKNKNLDSYDLVGISQLDYFDLFQKFDYVYGNQESNALDHIANVVLGERKLSYEEHGSLHNLYKENHQKFIDYNIRDVWLVRRLDNELGLIERAITISYKGGVNFNDAFGTTAIWDSIIYRRLLENNVIVPPETHKTKGDYPGGYVKDVEAKANEWVVSFDLNSLYPNLIVQYNMSPETLIPDKRFYPNGVDYFLKNAPDLDEDVSIAANGVCFKKNVQGILPKIVVEYYAERKAVKNQMLETKSEYEKHKSPELKRKINILDNTQMAIKILLNSLYGALGNQHFRYFDIRIAEAITLSGQLSIRWAEKAFNDYMNKLMSTNDTDYVIAIDTDSLYVNMKPLIDKAEPKNPVQFLDKACQSKFEKVFSNAYHELYTRMNAFDNRMVMGREVIADRGVWTAKKRYILNVHNSEGVQYEKPKLKIMGIEAVKSSTPMVVRNKFKKIFEIMLTENEQSMQKFIKDFETEFKTLPPEDVSFPRGVSDIDKWKNPNSLFEKGTPIHVRGSILYNHFIKEYGLDKNYEEIQNGSKVKFCYLRMPNPIRQNIIAFPQYLPREFKLEDYIDYDTQFEKTFKEPLKPIAKAFGWDLEKVHTLKGFFT